MTLQNGKNNDEITVTSSCHAAGWRALCAANAGIGTTVFRWGGVGVDWLLFGQRAGTP